MTEPTQPEQAIQTGAPQAAPETVIQEGMPSPDIIPLPPMAPAPEQTPAPVATGWSAFDVVLFVMLGTLSVFLGSFILTNSDFWLHLATGRGLADGTHQLGVDPFSFATVRDGAPVLWVNHSWLYDLGLYGLFSAFGGRGVAIFQAALMLVLFLLIVRIAGRGIRPMSAMLLAGLTLLVLSQRTLGATPMTVSLLLFGVLFLLMRRGGLLGGMSGEEKPSSWALWGLPLLFVVWVNLDGWFILGLSTLALVVLGNAVVHALGGPDRCPLSTQGLILLISVVAAMINPFHVRAFILPPEMAYALGKSVPVALGPGGEALRGLYDQDRDLLAGVGNVHLFHAAFFPSSAQTFSIAKVAFYVLLLLSFLSFVLAGFTARQPGDLPIGRLLAWLLVAYLGGTQILLIPLFAVIAGPITILNFAEFVQGRRRRAPAEPELMLLNPNLARFAVFVLVLVALALAWPGWLHSGIGERSPRRVAWQVEADPSLQAAAESLKQAGAMRVFNMNAEVAHYGAWFAPGVRFHLDQRLGLFPTEAARYARMRKQLREDASTVVFDQRRPSKTDWPGFFRAENIDHLIVTRFELGQAKTVAMMCWLQPWHWTQRHADGKTLVFAWSASGQADGALLPQALNRAAFGSVPPARRAPLGGANPPQTAPSLSSIYLDAHAAFPPLSAHEPHVHHLYFELVQNRWRKAYVPVWRLAAWAAPAGLAAAAPGSCLGPFTDVYSQWMEQFIFPTQMLAPDLGPPAPPLLMIRAARQALADNPNEARAHLALYHAYKLQGFLMEDRWIGLSGRSPEPNERIHVRQLQLVMALRNYLDLRPDDWEARQWLADLFYQTHQLDAGLEQMGLVIEKLGKERRKLRDRDKRRHDELFDTEKKLSEFHKSVEREMKRRRGDYDLETSKMEPMQKYFIAVQRPYAFLKPDNQPDHDPRGMGLTLEGLKQLQSVAVDTLPAAQKSALHVTRCQLLMQLGRLVEASDELSQVKEIPLQHLVRHFAALGDYGHMESNLAKIEEQAEQAMPVDYARRNLAGQLAGQMRLFVLGDLPTAPRLSMLLQPFSTPALAEILLHLRQAVNEHSNSRTLRGLLALEVGDTARAEEHFARALSLAGPLYFSDRPVAERYLELLRAQK